MDSQTEGMMITEQDLGLRTMMPDTTLRAMMRPRDEGEILKQFTPEQQLMIKHRQQLLSSIASFIGKDFSIPVDLNTPGGGWYWNFQENRIAIDPKDLVERSLEQNKYIVSHEGGHRRISRMEGIPLEVWSQSGFPFMMNAIEDSRVNNFVVEAYPRYKAGMDEAYKANIDFEAKAKTEAKGSLGFQPRFMQAGFEYINQWFRDTQGDASGLPEDLPDDVRAAVEKTLESARDSWLRYPSRAEADLGEETIQRYQQVSYEIDRDEIWPVMKELIDKDIEDMKKEQALQDMQQPREPGEGQGSPSLPQELKDKLTPEEQQSLSDAMEAAAGGKPIDLDSLTEEMKQKIQDYIDNLPEDQRRELAKKAAEAMKKFEDKVNEELAGKLTDDPDKKAERDAQKPKPEEAERVPVTKMEGEEKDTERDDSESLQSFRDLIEERLKSDDNVYEEMRREVLPLIDSLETDLREIFVQRRANRWDSGFRSGKRIDIKRRMQERAKGVSAVESKAWQRRALPQEKDYAISLLIDLSGSMEGDKIEETFKAAIVLAEVLNRLSIKTEILGFNDRIYEYQRFGQPMSKDMRANMGGMLQEVSDTSDTGRARWNDDGWALSEASQRLAKQREASEKFLFVMSDGQPVESPMHPKSKYSLAEIVKRIMDETDQKLIGLGIGRGTKHVENYYPNSIADIDVSQMAQNLSGVIKEVIVNYDSF